MICKFIFTKVYEPRGLSASIICVGSQTFAHDLHLPCLLMFEFYALMFL